MTAFRESGRGEPFRPPPAPRPCSAKKLATQVVSRNSNLLGMGTVGGMIWTLALGGNVAATLANPEPMWRAYLVYFAWFVVLTITVISWIAVARMRALYINGIPAIATVIGADSRRDRVSLRYEVDGHFAETTTVVSHPPPNEKLKAGDLLVIFVDPKNPKRVVVAPEEEMEQWKVPDYEARPRIEIEEEKETPSEQVEREAEELDSFRRNIR
jgi:hypothetical protein